MARLDDRVAGSPLRYIPDQAQVTHSRRLQNGTKILIDPVGGHRDWHVLELHSELWSLRTASAKEAALLEDAAKTVGPAWPRA